MDRKLLGRCFRFLARLIFLKHQCSHLWLVHHRCIRFLTWFFFIFHYHGLSHCLHQVIELLRSFWPRRWWTDRWCSGWCCMVWPLRWLEGQATQSLVANGLRLHHHIHHSWATQFRQGLCGRAIWVRLIFWATLIIIRMLCSAEDLGFTAKSRWDLFQVFKYTLAWCRFCMYVHRCMIKILKTMYCQILFLCIQTCLDIIFIWIYIHTYIHTCIHTYIHTYMQTYTTQLNQVAHTKINKDIFEREIAFFPYCFLPFYPVFWQGWTEITYIAGSNNFSAQSTFS